MGNRKKLLKQVNLRFYDTPEERKVIAGLNGSNINQTRLIKLLLIDYFTGNGVSDLEPKVVTNLKKEDFDKTQETSEVPEKEEVEETDSEPKRRLNGGFVGFEG